MKFANVFVCVGVVFLSACGGGADQKPIILAGDSCGLNAPLSGAVVDASTDFSPWGWAFDRATGTIPKRVALQLVSEDLTSYIVIPLDRSSRPDVAKAFGKPELEHSGFALKTKLSGLKNGVYNVAVVQQTDTAQHFCPVGKISVVNSSTK